MAEFDLVVRRARCATAADVFDADIGIRDGVIVALGNALAAGKEKLMQQGAGYCLAALMVTAIWISRRPMALKWLTIS